jgi:hypothetical protein
MPEETKEIVVQSPERELMLAPVMDLKTAKARLAEFQQFIKEYLVEEEDYGIIPGTTKPTLYKPGADKLCELYGLADEYEVVGEYSREDWSAVPPLFDYTIRCVLRSKRSGIAVASGMGSCNSYEGKYRWRDLKRKCPNCGQETVIKGKEEYGGGWICWKKEGRSNGCGMKFSDDDERIVNQTVGRIENDDIATLKNCITPDTLILTHDLQWVPAGEIETGDMLIGVEENKSSPYGRHLAVGEATVHGSREDLLYEITFEDGRKVRCNGEHQWLVKKIGLKGTEWESTEDIYGAREKLKGRPRKWTAMSLCQPWEEDTSKEAGYLAGLFDGDGCLEPKQVRIQFAQQGNTTLARMQQGLKDRGYASSLSNCKTQERLDATVLGKQVFQLYVRGSFTEQIRLLGSIRPPRLLERWLTMVDLGARRLEGTGLGAGKAVEIVSIEPVGRGEIIMLGTSCHTYIAEGLVCHNTILKMAKKRCLGSNTPILVSSSCGVSRCRVDTVFQMWSKENREPLMLPMEGGWGRIIGMSREERPQAIRIRLADGSAIFCSGEHVWPTTRGEQLTADIQVGDVMIRNRPELSGQMTVDESIAWTVGFYLAEGHCDRGHVRFTMAADEIESFIPMIEKAASIVGGSILASRRPKGNIGDIIVTGPAFAGLMQQFVLGTDCYGKHLSKYSWRQGKEFIRLLLKGYLDGDGHSEDYRGLQDKWIVGFTGENFALADDLRCISAILGYRHRLKRGVSTCGGKEFPTYEGWISFDPPRYNGKNLEEVTDIQIVNQKSVLYDIEVEDPHLFILPNGIVSHNSKVDATLSATRSSGIFTQDMEDIQPAVAHENKRVSGVNEQPQALVTDAQRKELFKLADAYGWKKPVLAEWFLGQYGFKSTAEIPTSKFDEIKTRLADESPKSDNGRPEGPADVITKDQIKLFWAVVKKQGWTEEEVHSVLKTLGVEHVHLMSKAQLDDVLKHFSAKPEAEPEREPKGHARRGFEEF